MDFPQDIKRAIEEEANNYSISTLKTLSKKISKNYLERTKDGENFINDEREVLVYALTRMPATFGAISFALEKGLELIDDNINSVIDLGSGTGSGILAAKSLISNKIPMFCVEKEVEMINFSKKYVSNDLVNYHQSEIKNLVVKDTYDLVMASYVLNELSDIEKQDALSKIISLTNKYILIVEPGTPENYKQMLIYRDYLLGEGFNIVAPCPHNGKCPITENDWCHFLTRVQRSKLHKLLKDGDAPYEDEKFTFLFMSKLPLVKKVDDRILRHPIVHKGNISIITCNKDCSIKQYLFTKKDKVKYKASKKLSAGDLL